MAPPPTASSARLVRPAAALSFALCTFFSVLAPPNTAIAAVFHSRSEIASLAFPDCDRVETQDVFLSADQRERIERAAGSSLSGDFLTIYKGYVGESLIGYAILDSHLVRTLTETLLIVIDTSGSVSATYVMAFHEPPEYMPSTRWLVMLEKRRLTDDLRVGRAIVGITGATLSARAVVASIRRSLAIYEVLLAVR